ncbi:protein FAM186A [Loxodonta africana]|uniref:protein FAM186A n=1 Tax=Loxodonta africana TaxID=9785 RepID=UPI0030CB2059
MFVRVLSEVDSESDSEKEVEDSTVLSRESKNVLDAPVVPTLEIPFSTQHVISRIDQAQLLRAKKDISMQLIDITSNVQRIINRYTIDQNLLQGRKTSIVEYNKQRRSNFMEKISTFSHTLEVREKTLAQVLAWLEEWNVILSEITATDIEERSHWIAQMEILPATFKAIESNVKILTKISVSLFEDRKKQKKKITSRGTLWKPWKERVTKRPATAHALRPDQMISDEFATNTKVSEIQDMLQELIGSSMFSKMENNAIKYISSTITNLSKALSAVNEELKISLQSANTLIDDTAEKEKELSLNIIEDLSEKNEMLQRQLQNAEEKCEQLIRSRSLLEHQIQVFAASPLKAFPKLSPPSSLSIARSDDIEDSVDSILAKEFENVVDEAQRKGAKSPGVKWDPAISHTVQAEITPDLTEQQQQTSPDKNQKIEDKADMHLKGKTDQHQSQKRKHTEKPHMGETSGSKLSDEQGEQKVARSKPSHHSEPQALGKKGKEIKSPSEAKSKSTTESKSQHTPADYPSSETKRQSDKSVASAMLEQLKVKSEYPSDRRQIFSETKVEPTIESRDKEGRSEKSSLAEPLRYIQSEKMKGKKHHISPETTMSTGEKTDEKRIPAKPPELAKSPSGTARETSESTRALVTSAGKSEQSNLEEFQKAIMAFLKEKIDNAGKPSDKKTMLMEELLLKRAEAKKLGIIKAKLEEYVQTVAEIIAKTLRKYKDLKKAGQVGEKPKPSKKGASFMPGLQIQKPSASTKADINTFLSQENMDPVISNLIQMILTEIESERDVPVVSRLGRDHKEKEEQRQGEYLPGSQEFSGMSLKHQLLKEKSLWKERHETINKNLEREKTWLQMKEGKQLQQTQKPWQEIEVWKEQQKQWMQKWIEQEGKQKQREMEEEEQRLLEAREHKMKEKAVLLKEEEQMRQVQEEARQLELTKWEKEEEKQNVEDYERQRQKKAVDQVMIKEKKPEDLEKMVSQTTVLSSDSIYSPRQRSMLKFASQLYPRKEIHENLKSFKVLPDGQHSVPITPPTSVQSSPPGVFPVPGGSPTKWITLTSEQPQALGMTLTLEQVQREGIILTPEQVQALGITFAPEQAQTEKITLTPRQAQALGITLTPQQAQAQGVTLTPQQAQAQGVALTPQQAQAQGVTLTPQQAQAQGVALTPQQAQAQRITLTPQQAQALGIKLTSEQAQAQGITLTPQQAQALGITLTPQQAQAQGVTLTPQQAQAQGVTLTPQQAQALGIKLTSQQAQAQGITLTPQQAQALGITLAPQQAHAQGITLTPQQAQALGITLTPEEAQVQGLSFTPQQAQALGITFTPEEAQALGITVTLEEAHARGITLTLQQAQALGITLTPQQVESLGITLTPQQAQALGITLIPQQVQTQEIILTPQQAQELGITLTPEQAHAQRITLICEQVHAQGITVSPKQVETQGITLTSEEAQAQSITFTPEEARALEITFTPEKAQAQGITLTLQQAQALGTSLTPQQVKVQGIILTPEEAQAQGITLTPEEAQELGISLTPQHVQALGVSQAPRQFQDFRRITLTPEQAQALGITLTPENTCALGPPLIPEQAQSLGVPLSFKQAQALEVPLTEEQTHALGVTPSPEQAQATGVSLAPGASLTVRQAEELGVPITPEYAWVSAVTRTLKQAQTLGPPLNLKQAQALGVPLIPEQFRELGISLTSDKDHVLGSSLIPEQVQPSLRPFQELKASLSPGQSFTLSPSQFMVSSAIAEKSSVFGVSSPLQISRSPLTQSPCALGTPLVMGIASDPEKLLAPQTLPSSQGQLTPMQFLPQGVPPTPRQLFTSRGPLTPQPPLILKASLTPRQPLIPGVPPTSGQIPSLPPGQPLVSEAYSIPGELLESRPFTLPEQPQVFHPPLWGPSTLGQHLAPWILPIPGQPSPLWGHPTSGQPPKLWASPTPGKLQKDLTSFVFEKSKKGLEIISPKSKSALVPPSDSKFKAKQAPKTFRKSDVSDTSEETQMLQDPFAMEQFRTFQPYLTDYTRAPVSQTPYIDEGALPTCMKPIALLPSLITRSPKISQVSLSEWDQKSRLPPIDRPWILTSVLATKKPKMIVPPSSPQELEEEEKYFVDVEAQRKNLVLLNQATKTSGLSSQMHTTARNLIIETLHTDTVRLGYLFRKYIAYRLIQGARNNIIKRLQAIQNTGKGYESRNLYIMLGRIDDYQKKVMQVWTEKQKSLEQKRTQCLRKILHLFSQLREMYKLNLSQPIPLIIDEKQMPASTKFIRHPYLELLTKENRKPDTFRKFRQQKDHMEAIWNADISTLSYPIMEKKSIHSLWAQLGGYPDIPRLLQLDVHSTFRKSLASIQSQ